MTAPARLDRASTLLRQALRVLEHVDGKSAVDTRAIDSVRRLVDSACFALDHEDTPVPEPVGAREGISPTPRSEWRR